MSSPKTIDIHTEYTKSEYEPVGEARSAKTRQLEDVGRIEVENHGSMSMDRLFENQIEGGPYEESAPWTSKKSEGTSERVLKPQLIPLHETGDRQLSPMIKAPSREHPDLGASSILANGTEDMPLEPLYSDSMPKTPQGLTQSLNSTNDNEVPLKPSPRGRDILESEAVASAVDDHGATAEDGHRYEIQTIIDQFDQATHDAGRTQTSPMSIEAATYSMLSSLQHPPRNSSLDSLSSPGTSMSKNIPSTQSDLGYGPYRPPQNLRHEDATNFASIHDGDYPSSARFGTMESSSPISPRSTTSLQKSLPPVPEPDLEPDLPFDFHRFLEQLRHRTADPVAKFLRSFLVEFGKKQWMVHEQVKIVSDFLAFITTKMAQCEVWKEVSDAEFDNAKEGMEKLVMNRLYSQTFSPAIPSQITSSIPKGKRKSADRPTGLGRRGQHQEDNERDDILAQKVRIYGWIREQHLEIAPVGGSGRRFLTLAEQGTILSPSKGSS